MSELPKIVRERLAQMPAGPHPDPDLLTAFAEQTLASRERSQVLAHLSACAECREVVALAAPPQIATEPEPATVTGPAWSSWSYMRWSGAVAVALVVASIALMFEQRWRRPELTPVTQSTTAARMEAAPADDALADARARQVPAESAPPQTKPAEAQPKQPQGRKDQPGAKPAVPAPPPAPPDGQTAGAVAASRDLPASEPQVAGELKKEKDENSDSLVLSPVPGKAAKVAQQEERERAEGHRAQAADVGARSAPVVEAASAPAAAEADHPAKEAAKLNRQAVAGSTIGGFGLVSNNTLWRIGAPGVVERSIEGKNWSSALSVPGVRFTTVAALGTHVWAGATGGIVYVSNDNGRRWERRQLNLNGVAVIEDVLAIAIDDARTGRTDTAGGTYITSDGGATWTRVIGEAQ